MFDKLGVSLLLMIHRLISTYVSQCQHKRIIYTLFIFNWTNVQGCMENPERRNNPDQPEQTIFCDWGHVQAAIIQTIKQDKPLYNYFTILKH